ncbi:hypothetical protein RHSIM_Rhsim09G0112000 [Rhododendron simsii]|uniref:Uncharacterized protein n=1 Tax=Rhododendron simsii TaxID=118357 RepID=A0A834GGS7_RHOSS|nr:hypothetical protein RHSIM_Rhsim09G0112000 [Rhododendron simsii]
MKMSTSSSRGGSKRRISSRGLGGALKEQKTKLYIIRRYRKKMKMSSSSSMRGSRGKISSRGLGGVLKEQKTRLYIIRRCVVMLLRWHD